MCVLKRNIYIYIKSYSPPRKKQLARPSHAWTTNVNNHEAHKETLLIKEFTSYYEWLNSFKYTSPKVQFVCSFFFWFLKLREQCQYTLFSYVVSYNISTICCKVYWDGLDLMLPTTRQINGATLFMGCPKRKKPKNKQTKNKYSLQADTTRGLTRFVEKG